MQAHHDNHKVQSDFFSNSISSEYLQYALTQLQQHHGLYLGEKHTDNAARYFITHHLPAFAAYGEVKAIFLEHFPANFLPLTRFFQHHDNHAEIQEFLKKHLCNSGSEALKASVIDHLMALLETAHQYEVKVYGYFEHHTLLEEANVAWARNIQHRAQSVQGKFLVLGGRLHAFSCPSQGVNSLCDLLHIPALGFQSQWRRHKPVLARYDRQSQMPHNLDAAMQQRYFGEDAVLSYDAFVV
jgi:hypothetical protein